MKQNIIAFILTSTFIGLMVGAAYIPLLWSKQRIENLTNKAEQLGCHKTLQYLRDNNFVKYTTYSTPEELEKNKDKGKTNQEICNSLTP